MLLVAVKDLESVSANYYIKDLLFTNAFFCHNIIDFLLSYPNSGQKVNETVLEELVAIAQENKEEKKICIKKLRQDKSDCYIF